MRSHTGGVLSLGGGAIYSTSTKQKMVARSSTEAELIATHDLMPQIMWTQHFLKAQGLDVGTSTLYQDNKSAMLLEMNGQTSSGKRTRHINIRFFYIKDRVDAKDIVIRHCPTERMYGDYYTKPTQGKLFKRMRSFTMNVDPSSKYYSDPRSVLKSETAQETTQQVTNESDVNETSEPEHVCTNEGSRSYINALMRGTVI